MKQEKYKPYDSASLFNTQFRCADAARHIIMIICVESILLFLLSIVLNRSIILSSTFHFDCKLRYSCCCVREFLYTDKKHSTWVCKQFFQNTDKIPFFVL